MVCYQVNRITIPCLFLVSLHCGPVVDFATLYIHFISIEIFLIFLSYCVVMVNSYLLGVYTKGSLHCPSLLILSVPLTLKEYSTPICSVSVMCCDVVVLVKLMLEAVTST